MIGCGSLRARGWLLALAAGVCLAARAHAIPVTLVADAHVNAARPAVNSGAISNVNVGGGYTGLLQFDLSLLPAGTTSAQITRAILRLYCNQLDTAGTVTLAPVSSAWSEYGVTYQTVPATGNPAQTFTVSQQGAFVAVDVTALVQGWVANPGSNQGLALTAASAVAQFDSKENDLTAHPATLDIQIASPGVAGAAGPAGPMGLQGLPGAAGAVGPQGPAGVPGVAGAAGLPGPVGPAGPIGPAGLQGTPGAMGVAGAAGFPGAPGQTGAAGPVGAPGPVGPVGPAGASGAAGPQGPAGVQGPPANFLGAWSSGTSYAPGDAVSLAGSSYVALISNMAQRPDQTPQSWALLAAAGAAGAIGPAGAQGLPGSPGPAGLPGPTGAIGPAGPAGQTGPAGAAGVAGAPGAPGAPGAQGAAGAAGAAGLNFRGAWVAGSGYALNDAVTYAGSTWLAQAASTSVQPGSDPGSWTVLAAAGVMGPSGATGAAAAVTVGSVTTGAPGSAASVTNSGTGSAAVLNFSIPQGATGAAGSGSGGGGGTSGLAYASMYHSVSYATTYYSVNNTNQDANEGADVLTWIPDGCTASKLVVYSRQGNTITVTLRAGSPGNMVGTPLTCQAGSNQSCVSTSAVTVAPGSFVDLEIDQPNATPAGVWTAVACN